MKLLGERVFENLYVSLTAEIMFIYIPISHVSNAQNWKLLLKIFGNWIITEKGYI